jgi:hypothetical protein
MTHFRRIQPTSKKSSFRSLALSNLLSPAQHSRAALIVRPIALATEKARERERERERERAPEMSADELRQDLEELQRLEGIAKRSRVQSFLANEIRNVDAKVLC